MAEPVPRRRAPRRRPLPGRRGGAQRARLLEGDGAGRRREGLRGGDGRRRRPRRARLARHLLRAVRLQGGLLPRGLPPRRRGARASASSAAVARGRRTGARSCAPACAPTCDDARRRAALRPHLPARDPRRRRRRARRARRTRCGASPTATARRSSGRAPARRRAPADDALFVLCRRHRRSSCAERVRAGGPRARRARGRLCVRPRRAAGAVDPDHEEDLTMDLTFNDAETAFRDELRAWLAANDPGARARTATRTRTTPGARDWQRRLAEGGWAGVHWPAEYGGRGATLTESAIFFEELGRAGAPLPANVLGLLLAGPTIMIWGTDEQKERYLAADPHRRGDLVPGLLRARRRLRPRRAEDARGQGRRRVGRHRPEGLDLAARSTRSGACSSRAPTPTRPKHKGLTYFLMDMEQDGVAGRARCARSPASRSSTSCSSTEARIPDANVLGGVGNGWKVALTTLMNERAGLGFFLQVRLRQLLDAADRRGGRARAARRPGRRRHARRPAPARRDPAPDRLPRA